MPAQHWYVLYHYASASICAYCTALRRHTRTFCKVMTNKNSKSLSAASATTIALKVVLNACNKKQNSVQKPVFSCHPLKKGSIDLHGSYHSIYRKHCKIELIQGLIFSHHILDISDFSKVSLQMSPFKATL